MNNIEKEIFNQFLIDFMADKMLLPEGEYGYLTEAPSQMSVPGALSIVRSIPHEQIEGGHSLLVNPTHEKNNFELIFKCTNNDIDFILNCGFYLYYKEYPDYKDLLVSDLKNYIQKDIKSERIKIYKNLKNTSPLPDSNLDSYYKTLQDDTDSQFRSYLERTINKNNDKGLSIVINKIVDILKPNFSNPKDVAELIEDNHGIIQEEKDDLETEEIGNEIQQSKDKGFIFNEEDFDSSIEYQRVLNLLSQNNNELYNKLFSNLTINFIYKKVYIELDPIHVKLSKDMKEPATEENKYYSSLIAKDINKKLNSIILEKNISLNIDSPLSFFDYISEAKYNQFKKSMTVLGVKPFVAYLPKITFVKIKNNVRIIIAGSEMIVGEQEKIKAKKIFDEKIFNLNISLEFNKNDINIHNYNINQHYKYNHAKKIYCSSNGIATENIEANDKILIKTTWNPRYYLPRNENRGISKDLVEYKTWNKLNNYETNKLNEIIEEYQKWISEIPNNIKIEKHYSIDLEKWNSEIQAISLGIKLLNISQKPINGLSQKINSIYQSWCYLNESFSLIDEKYKEWRLFQLCFLLMFIPSIVLKDETISNELIEKNVFTKEEVDNIILDAENRVNLLFFNAGGGKTEAFLAILIFSLFFERLNGINHGLTAIIKYPLRLLLTQQTNRVLKAICSAEIIRRKYKISFDSTGNEQEWDFDRSFSLGIWVGSSTTPNTIDQVEREKTTFEIKPNQNLSFTDKYGIKNQKGLDWETNLIINLIDESTETSEREQIIKELEDFSISKIPSFSLEDIRKRSISIGNFGANEEENEDVGHKKLTICPFCGKEHITLRVYQKSLVHFCLNRNCFWNLTTNSFRPLPFYIIDEDVYTRYPSVIISTTDKLARFGFVKPETKEFPENRHPLGMFGIAPFYDKETKKNLWDIPKGKSPNIEPFINKNNATLKLQYKFPSLIIQDETHLLIEGLGSFSAVFERNFIEMIKELDLFFKNELNIKNKKFNYPHIIASTATMASPEKQLLPIYNKSKVLLFPATGYKIYENFYSKPTKKTKTTNFNENSLEEYELYEISRIYNGFFLNDFNYYKAIKRYSLEYHKLIYSLFEEKISLTVFEKTIKNEYYRNLFNKLKNDSTFNFNSFIKDNSLLNKILINYAGSKNINDKLKSLEIYLFERDATIKNIISETNQVSITSDVEQTILQSVLNKIVSQKNNPLNDYSSKDIIKSIFATQSISHGVDSDMFNAMTFHGFPEFINEYIQASARIGRTNVGLVNCFPLPNNKDALIMNNFEAFHRFIDRPILSNSIDFSTQRIITRTLLGLFSCWFFNINRLKNDLTNINNSKLVNINEKLINEMSFKDFYADFKDYAFKVFSEQNQSMPTKIVAERLEKEIFNMLCEPYNRINPAIIQKINDLSNVHNKKYYMMTSLRDTQETAKIIIQQKNTTKK